MHISLIIRFYCSDETAAKIDDEVLAMIKTAHQKATDIMFLKISDKLHKLAKFLLERETITGAEFSGDFGKGK